MLMTFGENTNVYQKEIDQSGYFKFDLEESYGEGKKFVIQPASSGRKSPTFKVNLKERKVPEIAYTKKQVIAPVDSMVQNTVERRIETDIRLDPYLLPNTIALNEVVVSDYSLTPERAEMKELHDMPDVVIENKELMAKKKNWTGRLYSWLLFNFSEELSVRRLGKRPGFLYAHVNGAGFTYVVIDGMAVHKDFLSLVPDIPLEAVKSVELLRNTASANRYFCDVFPLACRGILPPPPNPAILAIYTYSGKGLSGAFPTKSDLLLSSALEFSPKREFYSPTYSNSEENSEVPDLRKLIFWKPDLKTDASGNASVTFHNGDIAGEVLIICEGIQINGGEIGRSETSYVIKE